MELLKKLWYYKKIWYYKKNYGTMEKNYSTMEKDTIYLKLWIFDLLWKNYSTNEITMVLY